MSFFVVLFFDMIALKIFIFFTFLYVRVILDVSFPITKYFVLFNYMVNQQTEGWGEVGEGNGLNN